MTSFLNLPFAMEQLQQEEDNGLTLREHYAGLAMQGIVSGCFSHKDAETIDEDWIANTAFDIADAMVAKSLDDKDE